MGETPRPAPAWLRAAAWVVRRLPAGRYVAMNRVPRGGGAFEARLPRALGGAAFSCDLRDLIAREVFFTGAYAPQETALVAALLHPGDTFVDVGANWGYFTLLAAHRVGARGRVVAMEPEPRLFALLARNAAGCAGARVDAVRAAAAERAGELELAAYHPDGGNWGVSSVLAGPGAERVAVPAATVDGVLDANGVGSVELLKMDIEGAEEMALRGMARGLAGGRYRRILLELHPSLHPSGAELAGAVARMLEGHGYRGWSVDSSPAATRRAAYTRRPDARALLRPLDGADQAWPHQLWAAPGCEPL